LGEDLPFVDVGWISFSHIPPYELQQCFDFWLQPNLVEHDFDIAKDGDCMLPESQEGLEMYPDGRRKSKTPDTPLWQVVW